MRSKVALLAVIGVAAIGAALVVLSGGKRAPNDDVAVAGTGGAASSAEQAIVQATPGVISAPESANPAAVSDQCGIYQGFWALRSADNAPSAGQSERTGQSQTNRSVQRNTVRSQSRVTINGVVVDEDVAAVQVEHNGSPGTVSVQQSSETTSVSSSTSTSSSTSRSKVTVNGEVVKDETVHRTHSVQVHNGLVSLLSSVISKRAQFEAWFLVHWYASALAGPRCADSP